MFKKSISTGPVLLHMIHIPQN